MKYRVAALLVSLLMCCVSCSRPGEGDSQLSLFKEYITSFSSGTVSAYDDVVIGLTFARSEWKPGQELDRSVVSVSPAVDGKVILLPNNAIAFRPAKPLAQDMHYKVVLHLSELIDVSKELADFRFTIKTIKQDIAVSVRELQSVDATRQFLNMTLKSADNLDPAIAAKLVSATQNGKPLKVRMNASPTNPAEFPFVIEGIVRGASDSEVTVKWDGESYDIERKGEMTFPIPAAGKFQVVHVSVSDEDNQSLKINFSNPLSRDQDFSGLVAVESAPNLQYAVDGNVLKVFFDQPLDGTLLLEVFPGIASADGYKMPKGYAARVMFRQMKPEVRLLNSGTILPSSSNLKLNFETVNLSKVDVRVYKIFENNVLQFLQDNELNGSYDLRKVALPMARKTIDLTTNKMVNHKKWNPWSLDLSSLINPEPGAIYRVEFSFKKSYSLYTCEATDIPEGEPAEPEEEEQHVPESDDDWNDYDYYSYYYDWSQRENPCSRSYYSDNKVATNVLATNLGVIAKRGENNTYFFAVTDITTTDPVSGASIELYNYQKQKLASFRSNADGTAIHVLDKKAFFAVVRKDKSTTYVKLDDGNSQSLSNFNVDGGEVLQKGLKGYLYGERGVWRPGDQVYLSFVLNDRAVKLPASHPIKLRVTDPNGKVVHQAVQPHQSRNHYLFQFGTEPDAPTGNYEAVVSVGGARFYKSLKIETIKPNRLRIRNGFGNKRISASQPNTATVEVTWLHGAAAKNLKVDMQVRFSPQETAFEAYPKYVFDDPARAFSGEELNVFSGSLNDLGTAQVTLRPVLQSQAPGMLKAAFITKAYESGGDVSTDVVTATYSPYKTYVGIKPPTPNKYGLLETGQANRFDVVAVDENGAPRQAPLEVRVYKVQWRWWWDASNDDLSSYSSSTASVPYYTTTIRTGANGKATFAFKADESDWGRYLVRISDPSGGHAAGVTVSVDMPFWSGRTREMNGQEAKMLVFSSDKEQYEVGGKATISFPSSEGCRALISLENGSQVVKTLWATTTEGETQVQIPVTSDMAPNVYVHITLLQPHAFSKNDSPIRLYGVIPIEVVDKNTMLEPKIAMPEVLKPEQKTTIRVSEKNGKSMSYTIAIVDDGLLDLTRFKTPNPWDLFFAREALGVKTWDVYDDVIGAYGGKINQVFSIGGDAELSAGKAKKADRFKPVVMFLGPFDLPAGQSKSHTVTLPRYVGSVRTMVVAANAKQGAYGSVEKTTPVRSPLMVLASLPRKITPGEKVTLPVTVFAMEKHVRQVNVKLTSNKYFRVIGQAAQTLSFDNPDEKLAFFELEALQATGIGKVSVVATSGKEKANYDVEMDVVNPNPVTHQVSEMILEPGKSASVAWEVFGVGGSNSAKLEVSSFPAIDFNRRLAYLIQYPHGCVEQITSGVFPQLYLADIADLDAARKQSIQRNVTAGIQTLSKYQLAGGAFAYWPGQQTPDDWGTTYAGHFLLEAEKKGYAVPANMKKQWIAYQKKVARDWRYYPPDRNDLPQAYRLYTLALAGAPDLASMNRLRETAKLSNDARLRLAAAYALAGQRNAGQQLLGRSIIDSPANPFEGDYFGSPDRNRAMALETLMLLGRKQEAFSMAVKLAKSLSSDTWMSTQTTAFSLYAVSRFAQQNAGSGINVSYRAGNKTVKVATAKPFAERALAASPGRNATVVANQSKGTVFVRVVSSGVLPVGREQAMQNGLQVAVHYTDRKGNPISVDALPQGTEFVASVTVKNTRPEMVNHLALSQILPSGWEIVNSRFTDYGESMQNNATYTDIRDDRTRFYFWLRGGEIRTFRVLLNASYPGRYYLPGVQAEAMYDNAFTARTTGKWITVLRK